jgi:hypothetical protein
MNKHLLAAHRLTLILVLVVALAVSASLAATGRVESHEGIHFSSDTALLVTNRDTLKICVESLVPGTTAGSILAGVRDGLPRLTAHPDFQRAGLAQGQITVDAGCPAPPTIADPRYDPTDMSGRPAVVATPSDYRLFIFFAPADQLDAKFTWEPRLTPQEVLCNGTMCQEVTTAFYLTPEELRDRATVERGLIQGVGLWPEGRPRTNPAFDPRRR